MTSQNDTKPPIDHIEDATTSIIGNKRTGDAVLALFNDPKEIHAFVDPAEEKRLIRKIDLMILPCLSVCYIFFYVRPLLQLKRRS